MDFSRLVVERGIDTPERVVLRLRGELDMARSAELRAGLMSALAQPRMLAIDLSELEFIDSSGFLVLHEAHTAAQGAGGRVVFVSPSATVQRIVELMGFDHLEFTEDRSLLSEDLPADGRV